jgi:hypothetical protein
MHAYAYVCMNVCMYAVCMRVGFFSVLYSDYETRRRIDKRREFERERERVNRKRKQY